MADITNTQELIDTITTIETSTDLPKGTVASKLDAVEINQLMNGIKIAFDKLYEKLRLLEDLHDFTKQYIQNEFKKSEAAFKRANANIDKTTDTYENLVVQSMTTNFATGIVVTDRDGTPIPTADYVDGTTLIPENVDVLASEPTSAVVTSDEVAYRRISTPARNYKSFYADEEPPAVPIREVIDFVYASPASINFINISPFRCKILEMSVTDDTGVKAMIDPASHMIKRTKVKRLSMQIESTKCDSQEIELNFRDPGNVHGSQYLDGIKGTIYETIVRNSGNTKL